MSFLHSSNWSRIQVSLFRGPFSVADLLNPANADPGEALLWRIASKLVLPGVTGPGKCYPIVTSAKTRQLRA